MDDETQMHVGFLLSFAMLLTHLLTHILGQGCVQQVPYDCVASKSDFQRCFAGAQKVSAKELVRSCRSLAAVSEGGLSS